MEKFLERGGLSNYKGLHGSETQEKMFNTRRGKSILDEDFGIVEGYIIFGDINCIY